MPSSSAALGLPGALIQPLANKFGWTTEQISSAMSIRFVLFGLMGPFAAVLMELFGLRRIVCSALVLIAPGMLLSTRMTSLWQLFVLWGGWCSASARASRRRCRARRSRTAGSTSAVAS